VSIGERHRRSGEAMGRLSRCCWGSCAHKTYMLQVFSKLAKQSPALRVQDHGVLLVLQRDQWKEQVS
jgi:hypothetical protein